MCGNGSDLSPIFVIGAHRSGTTWVANTLCNHSAVFGIQAAGYWGIKESWFFSHLDGRFGDLSQENYRKLLSVFTRTTFFELSGVRREELQALCPRDYADFFGAFMAMAAERVAPHEGQHHYWLEKTPVHTLYLQQLISSYPDARFVGIEREIEAVVRSATHLNRHKDAAFSATPVFLARSVLHWHKYRAYLEHFSSRYPDRFFVLKYDELQEDTANRFRAVLSFLRLEWEPDLLSGKFDRNTSFRNAQKRDTLSRDETRMIGILSGVAQLVPFRLFKLHEAFRPARNNSKLDSLFR